MLMQVVLGLALGVEYLKRRRRRRKRDFPVCRSRALNAAPGQD